MTRRCPLSRGRSASGSSSGTSKRRPGGIVSRNISPPSGRTGTVIDTTQGRVTLTVPGIAENGQSVFTTVAVASPMTESDHVRAIHILSPRNPIALITSFHLGPRAGRARVSTNIRLAGSQTVTALAEMSDGTFWQDSKDVVVTVAACIDGS